MKMSKTKRVALAIITLLSASAASAGEADAGLQQKNTYISELLKQGYIRLVPESGFYEINMQKLDALILMEKSTANDDASRTLNMLQSLVGNDSDVRNIDAISASMGTQDWTKTQ